MVKVILFKSESEGSDKFVELLKENNFEVGSIPSIDFRFKSLDILLDKFKHPESYEGVIFTSPRSIYATQQSLANDDRIKKNWSDKKNFTIGDSSHSLARELLSLESNGKESGNAQNLSPIIIEDYKRNNLCRPFLFPCGNQKQDILGDNLRAHGIQLEYVEVYETIPHPNLESAVKEIKCNSDIDFIVYFSPSGVKYSLPFVKTHEIDLSKIKLIAIGPSTQKCMRDNDLKCYKMCEKPSPESLLEILN